jgi:hypothetical protein
MDSGQISATIDELVDLVREHYVDVSASVSIGDALTAALRSGRYADLDARGLAQVVTSDLQSINGDKHLRLVHHDEPLEPRQPGDDAQEYAAMARWAADTGNGVARIGRLGGNVGLVEIAPVLFPAAISGEAITAAMTLIASSAALILDLRSCLGGDPELVAWLCSYLYNHEPVELTSLDEPKRERFKQSWTVAYVPGQRFGPTKPVFVLTSAVTFSGGEQLSYDLQALGRATIIGERTRGGAHAREGFRLGPHLEATISVARAVSPITGTNWEGVGVTPDVAVPAKEALDRAHELALAAIGP